MVNEPMTVAMLKERIAQDQNITDLRSRCALHVQMFLLANAGDDVWDEADYNALGCSDFDPWELEIER